MFGSNLFTYPFLTLTIFQYWFLKDGNVVFSVMISFIDSTFILSFCVNICFVVFGCVVFLFSAFHDQFEGSCFSVSSVLI